MRKKILNKILQGLIWILFLLGIVLAIFAYQGYKEVKKVNDYFNFIRESTNSLILSVNDMTNGVNKAETLGDKASDVYQELQENQNNATSSLEKIKTQNLEYQLPLDADEISQDFGAYLDSIGSIIEVHREISEDINNSEKSEVVYQKIDQYNELVKDLDTKLQELDNEMNDYSANYKSLKTKLFQKLTLKNES